MARMTRLVRRVLLTVGTAVIVVGATASAAGAHAIEGVDSTNYLTRIDGIVPPHGDLRVKVVEAGSRLELENRTDEDVIVFGYQAEPYLRIDAKGGVFQNRLSPATYINADRQGSRQPPPDADPSANPEWVRIADGFVVRWHDHRAHWMGAQDAPAVRRTPGARHVVIPEWEVPLEIAGEPLSVKGDLTWVPGPSPAPWYALASGLAALVVAASFGRRPSRRLAAIVALLVLVDLAHIAAKALSSAEGFGAGVGAILPGSFFSIAAWLVAGFAVRLLLRGSPDGPFAAAFAGAVIALFGGLADIADLSRSQLPVAVPDVVARLFVSSSLGIGLGLVLAAVLLLRRRFRPDRGRPTAGSDPAPQVG
jgi:hypothetical protein